MKKNLQKFNLKLLKVLFVSFLMVGISFIYIYQLNAPKKTLSFVVQKGRLNLEAWDEKESIPLDGEWTFYPGHLLKPGEEAGIKPEYISVPGPWTKAMGDQAEGVGTYRLQINLPEDGNFALKTSTLRLASEIYVNGKKVGKTGKVGLDRESFIPESKYQMVVAHSENRQIDLLIAVSSFGHRTGGIIKSVKLGTFEKILFENRRDRALEALAISICLLLGIYFFTSYQQRKHEKFMLYFALSYITLALYLSTMNEQLLDLVFCYTFTWRTRLQILTMLLTALCLLRATHDYFKDISDNRWVKALSMLNLITMLTLFSDLEKLSATVAGIMQGSVVVSMGLSYFYVLRILVLAIYRREDDFEYLWPIALSLIFYWAIIVLKIIFEIDIGNIQTFTTLFLFFGIAFLIGSRQRKEQRQLEYLSNKLVLDNKLKDAFLRKTSEELREPLQRVKTLTTLLAEGRDGSLNPKQQKEILFIHNEVKGLSRRVEDLLEASKVASENREVELRGLNVYNLAGEILGEMRLLLGDKDLSLINAIQPDFPLIKADYDKFTQILYNLLYNAVKFTPQGEIRISSKVEGEHALFEIKDTGIGIREEDLPYIFEMFYSEEKDWHRGDGLGLGLTIVKHLLDLQGGEIWVSSLRGQGSVFSFSLPLYDGRKLGEGEKISNAKEQMETLEAKEDELFFGKMAKILVVESAEIRKNTLRHLFKKGEAQLLFASGEAEVREILDNQVLDLVLMDFSSLSFPGGALCLDIREKYSMVELPILILTASSKSIDFLEIWEYGANDYLKKPVDEEELKLKIQSLLRMKASMEKGIQKEFQFFYSQISPHFLYNTLNTIIGLSYTDLEKTRRALHNLSIYFRGKLDLHKGKNLISLEDELELVRAYLDIEHMRFGEKLQISYAIDTGVQAQIPPLMIQTVVENAIKHGIALKEGPGKLYLGVIKEDGMACITIEDDGVGMSSTQQEELLKEQNLKLGFTNTSNRIGLLRGATLHLESEPMRGTRVTIRIPRVGER